MSTYAAGVERHMVEFYRSLSEKDRRRYAAVEAEKLGHGGVRSSYFHERKSMRQMKHVVALAALGLLAGPLAAHEEGAPFSGAIIEPLVLHHAHIENEQRLNLSLLRRLEGPEGGKRNGQDAELELGWANERFDFGVEAFIPFSRRPGPDGEGNEAGLGDIELRPLKLALVNRPDFVVTTATAITLPAGDERRGLGSGNTSIAQHLFVDKAFGNWYAGLNLGLDSRIGGDSGSGVEYGAVLAYSFIHGTPYGALAAARPAQRSVVSVSLELVREKRLSGPDRGEQSSSLVPGLVLWQPSTGWQLRAGVSLPRSGEREAARTLLLQVSNHLDWDAWLRR